MSFSFCGVPYPGYTILCYTILCYTILYNTAKPTSSSLVPYTLLSDVPINLVVNFGLGDEGSGKCRQRYRQITTLYQWEHIPVPDTVVAFGQAMSCLSTAVDDINPALPIIRNIPRFPEFRILKLKSDLYHQS